MEGVELPCHLGTEPTLRRIPPVAVLSLMESQLWEDPHALSLISRGLSNGKLGGLWAERPRRKQ